jgi:hypothetical protein
MTLGEEETAAAAAAAAAASPILRTTPGLPNIICATSRLLASPLGQKISASTASPTALALTKVHFSHTLTTNAHPNPDAGHSRQRCPPAPTLSNVNQILPMATPLLLDLAWAIVTVQLLIITFWLSSENIRQRFRSTPPLPPPTAAPQGNDDVVLKKRRRRLQPKSVWDTEQVVPLAHAHPPFVILWRRSPSRLSVRA